MSASSAGRRTGRRPGQPDTRQEILEAAREAFAENGFAGTSVRSVAQVAGVDPALVHHYFGTKEGLFRSALEIPIEPEALLRHIFAEGIEQAPARLVHTFIGVWDGPVTGPVMLGLLRRVVADPEQTDQLRDFVTSAILRVASARLTADGVIDHAELRFSLVASHLAGLMIARKVLLIEPIASMPADRLAALVTPTVAGYLLGELPSAPPGTATHPHSDLEGHPS